MNIEVSKFPPDVRARLGLTRGDVAVIVADEVSSSDSAPNGKRSRLSIHNQHGETLGYYRGSFGGANPFETSALAAFLAYRGGKCEVPADGYVAVGYDGEAPHAIYARAHVVARLLGLDAADVDVIRDASIEGASRGAEVLASLAPAAPKVRNLDRWVLDIYAGIKSGYREDELRRLATDISGNRGLPTAGSIGLVQASVEDCVARGWLKRNKAGATSITTEGKNLRRVTPLRHEIASTWMVES